MTTTTRPSSGNAYTALTGADREALLREGLGCIISGRPFPDALRPAPIACVSVASCEAGIARIVRGPTA